MNEGKHTPGARWRENGEADPHGTHYDCERAKLAMGHLTDDELADAVFMHDHSRFDLNAVMRGEPSSIVLLTAAKERIRWLSRKLAEVEARATQDAPDTTAPGAEREVGRG